MDTTKKRVSKVLFVQDSLGTGGAERYNLYLWDYLREIGVKVTVVVLEHRQVGIEKLVLEKKYNVKFINGMSLISQVQTIARIVKAEKPDLVHSVLFKATIRTRFARLLTRFTHVESLVNCSYAEIRYSDPKVNSKALELYRLLDKYTHRFGTDRFLAITEEVKRHYQEKLHINKSKIDVIYRGRPDNKWVGKRSEIRKGIINELKLTDDTCLILHAGRQEFQKDHLTLLKSIKKLSEQKVSNNIKLLLCGREGNATNDINHYLSQNDINEYIVTLGHRYDLDKIMVASDIFVFPSVYEGLGGSLIEAQAAKLPLICSDIPVFKEIVPDFDKCQFAKGDYKALAGKIQEFVTDKDLRKSLSQQSYKNFIDRFYLDDINKSTLAFYQGLF